METLDRERITELPVAAASPASLAIRLQRVLVATNGTEAAAPALRLANALAAETGAAVELIAVFTPRMPGPAEAAPRRIACERCDRGQVAELARAVRLQRRRAGVASLRWPIRLAVGDPVRVVAEVARDDGFDIVMLGIGRPDPVNRGRGDETALRVALTTQVPMLAVGPDATGLLHRAVVVVDSMDDVDRRMVDTVVSLLAAPAELHIALTGSWRFDLASGVRAAREAGVPDSVTVSATALQPDSREVIALARRVAADLIAAPSHGRTPEERILMQDLIVPLLRSADCSVLAVPPMPES